MIQIVRNSAVAVAFSALTAFSAHAQIETPQPSPLSTVTQRVGLTDISVTYSRPSLKGRKVFGKIVKYDQPWRTGANNATTITFKDAVTFEGAKVPAGEYALYTIPGESAWTIVLNSNTKLGGSMKEYNQEQDVARVKVKPIRVGEMQTETFTIAFMDLTPNSANLALMWENVLVKAKIGVEYDQKVMTSIEKTMQGGKVEPYTYFTAARYYYDNNKDMKKALEWVNKATEKDPTFWMLHTKALIQAANNDHKGAIATANQSIELARKADNQDYVQMNQEKIAEWTPKTGKGKK